MPNDPKSSEMVGLWEKRILAARKQYEKAFARMRTCSFLARYGHSPQNSPESPHVNVIGRHVAQKVAALYAKNPRVRWTRRRRLETRLWDGKAETLMMAQQAAMLGDPMAAQVIAEAMAAKQAMALSEKVGRTLETLFAYQIDAQVPGTKIQMKRLVRRCITTGIGYLDIEFQRMFEPHPDSKVAYDQVSVEMANLQAKIDGMREERLSPESAQAEELMAQLQAAQQGMEVIAHEGLVFSYPRSTSIIPSPATESVVGWVGCDWLAKESLVSISDIRAYYGVDVGTCSSLFTERGEQLRTKPEYSVSGDDSRYARTWEVWHRTTGLVFVIAQGHSGWLQEPEPPFVRLRRFYNTFALTFNDDECDRSGLAGEDKAVSLTDDSDSARDFFPLSDVWQIRHAQAGINHKTYSRSLHVQASHPRWVTFENALSADDARVIANLNAFDVGFIRGGTQGDKISDKLQAIPVPGIDPNVYDIQPELQHIMLAVGTQEANLGPTGGATATESSIAETSRNSAIGSNVDDLDQFLNEIAESSAEILLSEATPEYVQRVVGPGAVWPEMSRQEIADQVTLEVQAGSSGLPNQAQQAAITERMAPLLVQIPGIQPSWVAKQVVKVVDDTVDVEEAIIDGLPSIVAMNAQAKPQAPAAPGGPPGSPEAQGAEGADKQPRPDQAPPGPQPAFPSPTMSPQPA